MIIPDCKNCSLDGNSIRGKLDGGKVVCSQCGSVIMDNIFGVEGEEVSNQSLSFELEPEDTVFLRVIKSKNDDSPKHIVKEKFPDKLYSGGRKIKKYAFDVRYTVKVYYE